MLRINGLIAQSILVVLLLISFYAFFLVNIYYKVGLYLKWLNILLLIITVYGLVLFFSGVALYPDEYNLMTSLQFGYLQRIYTSVLPIYVFYFFSMKGCISDKNMMYIFFIFLVFSILMYYNNYYIVSEYMEREEITNNMGYRFVPLIPMLALFKMKNVWKYIFLIIIFAYIMMAMKRGAILVGSIALLLYMCHHLKVSSTKQFFNILVLSIVAICFIYFFVMNLYETSDYFKSRLYSTMEGDTSTRSWIYSHYYDYFVHKTSDLQFLFGCGANATLLLFENQAHNDWLEFAINEGILGIILYVVYWILFVREWKMYYGLTEHKKALGDIIIIYFIVSWFSMSFDGMPLAGTICIGYCLANSMKYRYKDLGGKMAA